MTPRFFRNATNSGSGTKQMPRFFRDIYFHVLKLKWQARQNVWGGIYYFPPWEK